MRLLSKSATFRAALFLGVALSIAACGSKSGLSPASRSASNAESSEGSSPSGECVAGQIHAGERCVKQCATSDDCGPNGYCQEFRSTNDDGTIGSILGKGCEKAESPSSSALVQLVRASNLPGGACAGSTGQATLGGAYSDQAKAMQTLAKVLSVPFVETGECKAATVDDPSRQAKAVSSAVWYCTVLASPNWDKVKRNPGDEEGGTNFSVGFALDSSGAIVAESLHCVAAG
jgi:hypothetical protein